MRREGYTISHEWLVALVESGACTAAKRSLREQTDRWLTCSGTVCPFCDLVRVSLTGSERSESSSAGGAEEGIEAV